MNSRATTLPGTLPATLPPTSYSLEALTGRVTGKPNGNTLLVVEPNRFRMNGFLWFVLIFLIAGLFLYLFKPSWVLSQNPATGELNLDWGKLILWALLIAVVIMIIFWLLRGVHGMITE